LFVQGWDFVSGYVPDEFIVHAEVAVDKSIAHAGHGSPLKLRVFLAKLIRNVLGSLSNNLDTPHNGTLQRLIIEESIELLARDRLVDERRFHKHVTQILSWR